VSADPDRPRAAFGERWLGQRGRRILHAGGWSLVAKACAAANLYLSVPLVLHALGAAQFGAWATLVSLVAFAGFLDFGFGNGAMNLVAAAHGRADRGEVAAVLHASRRVLLRVALVLGVAALLVLPLPWHAYLGLPAMLATGSRVAVATLLLAVAAAVPLNLASRVQLGLGRGERAFRWQALGQLAALGGVALVARAQPSLAGLVAAAVLPPLFASAGNAWQLGREFAGVVPVAPDPAHAHLERRIRREGALFFVLQLCAALAFSSDLPLITALRGPEEAGTYAVVQRLFSFIPLCLALVWAPLWPIYRQALAAGDRAWALRTLRRTLLVAVAFAGVAGAAAAWGFAAIAGVWVQHPLAVGGVLLAGFAAWCVLEAAGTCVATFLNAASVMRFQVVTACAFAALCVAGKAWVIAHAGIDWVPWVTVGTYLATSVIPFVLLRQRILAGVLDRSY
jgi:O-antigen/teichoic acid export membrane protein